MFKMSNVANDIYQSMQKRLISNQLENQHGFNKLAKAVNYLNAAAEIFELAGMAATASEVTEVLNELAQKLVKS